MEIISANERLNADYGAKVMLLGEPGIGKTTQLLSLNQERTLFLNIESGDLSVRNFKGKTLEPRDWQDCKDISVLLGGPDPAVTVSTGSYSQEHYDRVAAKYPDFAKEIQDGNLYDTLFVDSISVASRLCYKWAEQQPDAQTKGGTINTMKVYGHLRVELVSWCTHLQHIKNKNVIFVGILDKKKDEADRDYYEIQLDGSARNIIPGIVDEQLCYITIPDPNQDPNQPKQMIRKFVCNRDNIWDLPAKDRSGKLELLEEAHLGNVLVKITNNKQYTNQER